MRSTKTTAAFGNREQTCSLSAAPLSCSLCPFCRHSAPQKPVASLPLHAKPLSSFFLHHHTFTFPLPVSLHPEVPLPWPTWPTYPVFLSHPLIRMLLMARHLWLSQKAAHSSSIPLITRASVALCHLPWKELASRPAAKGPSAIFHHMAPRPSTLSHGKYQDNQTCLTVIHVTICLGFPLFECCNTQPASQNISGFLLSKFLNLNKHERPNSALGSVCTNPICDIKWSCLNQSEHGVWPRVFQMIYGVHMAALNQGEPVLSAVFKQCQYTQGSVTAMAVFGTRADNTALSPLCHFYMALVLSDTACLVKQDPALSELSEIGMINF